MNKSIFGKNGEFTKSLGEFSEALFYNLAYSIDTLLGSRASIFTFGKIDAV